MNNDEDFIPLTAAEGKALLQRLESGEQTELTAAERAYLMEDLAKARQGIKDIIVDQLMQANIMSRESRAQEEHEQAVGLRDNHRPDAYDALDKAIADTAAYISDLEESLVDDMSFEMMHKYLIEQSNQMLDFYAYEGYRALAKYFENY